MNIDEIISRLPHAKKSGSGWMAKCPSHDDGRESLSINMGEDARILLHCHAGCTLDQICAAIGLRIADLFVKHPAPLGRNIVATYDYRDETGKLLFQVCRLDPKDFRQRKPDPSATDGWTWKTSGVRRVLFRLPELLMDVAAGRPIFVCEGEKDCLALVAAGLAATCNPGGAGKWQRDFVQYFKRADVVIIADKDDPGRKHAKRVAESLHGTANRIRIVELPDVKGKRVKDAADFFDAGGQAADLTKIVDSAEAWETTSARSIIEEGSDYFEKMTLQMRGEIIGWLMSKEGAPKIRHEIAKLVVDTLTKIGRFYFHTDLRDFASAMYFNAHTKRLEKISSDAFAAWLSEWTTINRAEIEFRFIMSEVKTTALSSPRTTGILPEAFWAARPGAIYLSNGDGQAVKITAEGAILVDNGTDAVLFASGKTLPRWNLTTPQDPFETCRIFRQAHCAADHGKELLRLWVYSLPTNPKSKPPICAVGEIRSGKTRMIKAITELYGLPFVAQNVEDEPRNFWPSINEGGLFCLDNADTKCRWLADALANAATDGCSKQRRLYSNSETVTLHAHAWVAITTANPTFASDSGLSDRLLLVRMAATDEETSDSALSAEIAANRDSALSHIAHTLTRAYGDQKPVTGRLNARHPDFSDFAVRIGRALGREAEARAALRAAEADKAVFCIENDAIGVALLGYLQSAGKFIGSASELLPHILSTDRELEGKISARALGKWMATTWPHLRGQLGICFRQKDRNGVFRFTFSSKRGVCGV